MAKSLEPKKEAAVEAKKEAVKVEKAEKVEAVKAPAKKPAVKAEKKPAAKKTAVKKTAAKKPAAKKKAAAEKSEVIYVQFAGGEWSVGEVREKIMAAYVAAGHRAGMVKKLMVYLKPEEGKAYYVINDKTDGSVEL